MIGNSKDGENVVEHMVEARVMTVRLVCKNILIRLESESEVILFGTRKKELILCEESFKVSWSISSNAKNPTARKKRPRVLAGEPLPCKDFVRKCEELKKSDIFYLKTTSCQLGTSYFAVKVEIKLISLSYKCLTQTKTI